MFDKFGPQPSQSLQLKARAVKGEGYQGCFPFTYYVFLYINAISGHLQLKMLAEFEKGDLVWFDPGIGYVLPGEVVEFMKQAQVRIFEYQNVLQITFIYLAYLCIKPETKVALAKYQNCNLVIFFYSRFHISHFTFKRRFADA